MIKSLYVAPLALVVSTIILGASAAPAMAASPNACATDPARVRAAATTAQPEQQKKALQLVSLGEQLCLHDNSFEASKKFAAAAKALGTDIAQLPAPSAQ